MIGQPTELMEDEQEDVSTSVGFGANSCNGANVVAGGDGGAGGAGGGAGTDAVADAGAGAIAIASVGDASGDS